MAITWWGFSGDIGAPQWAKTAALLGADYGVDDASDWACTPVAGVTHTIRISAGGGFAHGVRAVSDASVDVSASPAVTTGTRWDTVAAKYDWSAGTVSFVILPGSATQAYASDVTAPANQPGGVFYQPLALVQFTAGVQTATSVLGKRTWPSKVYAANSVDAMIRPRRGMIVDVDGTQWRYTSGGWVNDREWVSPALLNGWQAYVTAVGDTRPVQYTRRAGIVSIVGSVRRSVPAAQAPSAIFQLSVGYRPPVPVDVVSGWTDAYTQVTIGTDGVVYVATAGPKTTPSIPITCSFPV